ncbi:MAG: hypothetical protein ABJD11_10510, partial [Gemmatimonadota bacterium]
MPPRSLVVALIALTLVAHTLCAQQPDTTAASGPPPIDSLIVRGNSRLSAVQILGTAGLVVHQSANYRDLQRAIRALFRTGQFDDVAIDQQGDSGKVILLITVK